MPDHWSRDCDWTAAAWPASDANYRAGADLEDDFVTVAAQTTDATNPTIARRLLTCCHREPIQYSLGRFNPLVQCQVKCIDLASSFQMSSDANLGEQLPNSPGNSTDQPDVALTSEDMSANLTEEQIQVQQHCAFNPSSLPACSAFLKPCFADDATLCKFA